MVKGEVLVALTFLLLNILSIGTYMLSSKDVKMTGTPLLVKIDGSPSLPASMKDQPPHCLCEIIHVTPLITGTPLEIINVD